MTQVNKLLVSVFVSDGKLSISAIAVSYFKDKMPEIQDYFYEQDDVAFSKNVYFAFEDFTFSYQHSELMYWGDFHFNKLLELSMENNGDFHQSYQKDKTYNMQDMFRERLKMKRFVSFKDAYSKISGLHFLKSLKHPRFMFLENQAMFIPYLFGDKFIKRVDRVKSKK